MKRKNTPAQFKAAKQFATEISGYGPSSPIWGQRLPEVLTSIEEKVRQAIVDIESAAYTEARDSLVNETIPVIEELKKRIAKGSIIKSQLG